MAYGDQVGEVRAHTQDAARAVALLHRTTAGLERHVRTAELSSALTQVADTRDETGHPQAAADFRRAAGVRPEGPGHLAGVEGTGGG